MNCIVSHGQNPTCCIIDVLHHAMIAQSNAAKACGCMQLAHWVTITLCNSLSVAPHFATSSGQQFPLPTYYIIEWTWYNPDTQCLFKWEYHIYTTPTQIYSILFCFLPLPAAFVLLSAECRLAAGYPAALDSSVILASPDVEPPSLLHSMDSSASSVPPSVWTTADAAAAFTLFTCVLAHFCCVAAHFTACESHSPTASLLCCWCQSL